MKRIFQGLIVFLILILFSSCALYDLLFPSEEDLIVGEMLDDDQLDILRDLGMPINSGDSPPDIEGYYLTDDLDCVEDTTGVYLQNLYYNWHFYDQSGNEIKVSYFNDGSDYANGQGSFIFGEGNDFTIYVEVDGNDSGVSYTQVSLFSGTLTSEGIEDFTEGFIMTDKIGDYDSILMDVNEARIYEEGDGLAEEISNPGFSRLLSDVQVNGESVESTVRAK